MVKSPCKNNTDGKSGKNVSNINKFKWDVLNYNGNQNKNHKIFN